MAEVGPLCNNRTKRVQKVTWNKYMIWHLVSFTRDALGLVGLVCGGLDRDSCYNLKREARLFLSLGSVMYFVLGAL